MIELQLLCIKKYIQNNVAWEIDCKKPSWAHIIKKKKIIVIIFQQISPYHINLYLLVCTNCLTINIIVLWKSGVFRPFKGFYLFI